MGNFQTLLDEESRALTIFNKPRGKFRYCQALMGLCSFNSEFCANIDAVLYGIKNVKKIVYDILISGENEDELLQKVEEVLRRCEKNNITLSKDKIQYGTKVKFADMLISGEEPKNLTELRSLIGLTNQLDPYYTKVTAPFRELLKNNVEYQWQKEQQKAFDESIRVMNSTSVLAHFDVKK
ncbi:uncharacterized protein [Lepeophtheirus salmonis]|uniref:uncharacterized protein n=1 Tax=Lepeophtheirus salmonis TaxID=72036 RepID=UPI003AF3DAA3